MSQFSVRSAIGVTAVALMIMAGGHGTVASAADCEIPAFLATGTTYNFSTMDATISVTVVEIDRQSCWVKGQWQHSSSLTGVTNGIGWFNLRQILAIEEVQAPPTQAQPGQRR
jgi:hypothetical protein